ncbi:hypothetical protein [Streptacidiphilus sp. EB129]|uniref:NADase-type glycan-binding domain-containing protein n=1 Tax=Streptacidiphilus sp. EB129 TaxID=3156262 RepID=UPI00351163E1
MVAPVERADPASDSASPAPAPAPAPQAKDTRATGPVAEEVREQAPRIARARAVAVTRTAPSRRLQPGDLVCGVCGEGNPSTRNFCSRCGTSLVEAVKVKEPWWRRFVPRRGPRVVPLEPGAGVGGGKADGKAAAQLAKSRFDLKFLLRQIYRKVRVVGAVAILCAGMVYGAYPPFRSVVNARVQSVKASVTNALGNRLSPIHAVSVTANVSMPGYPPLNAADENTTTYWLAPWSTSREPTLTFTFAHRVTLKQILLRSGAGNAYVQDGRPSELRLVFSNGESFTVTPQDKPQEQPITISHADLITSMQIQVGAVYPGSSGSSVAITEIELFGLTM